MSTFATLTVLVFKCSLADGPKKADVQHNIRHDTPLLSEVSACLCGERAFKYIPDFHFLYISEVFQCMTYVMKKPLQKIHLLLTSISFLGVLLILKPSFLFSAEETEDSIVNPENLPLYIAVIFAAFCYSMTMIFIHDISGKVGSTVNLHYSYIGHLFTSSILVQTYKMEIDYNHLTWGLLANFFGIVIFALLTQYMIFSSMSLKKPSYIMPFGYLTVICSFFTDMYFFGSSFDTLSVIGMCLTSAGLFSKLLISESKEEE